MCGSVGVPKREDRVVVESCGLMHFEIHPAIATIHILIQIRRKHAVIHGRVKIIKRFFFGTFNHNFLQLRFPFGGCLCSELVKALITQFRLHICFSPCLINRRNSNGH